MSTPDFSKLSIKESEAIIAKALEARSTLTEMRRAELLRELEELDGVPLLASASKTTPERSKSLKAKTRTVAYRDQNGNYWSSFGGRPVWIDDHLNKGERLKI